jgi:hypothetical protein
MIRQLSLKYSKQQNSNSQCKLLSGNKNPEKRKKKKYLNNKLNRYNKKSIKNVKKEIINKHKNPRRNRKTKTMHLLKIMNLVYFDEIN